MSLSSVRIVHLSDTHGRHRKIRRVPDGDVLVHSGDLTRGGGIAEAEDLARWLGSLPHARKVVVAGNHDWCGVHHPPLMRQAFQDQRVDYLLDEQVEIFGLTFWGTPYTPEFCGWAFMEDELELMERYATIPEGVDVVVSHGPALGVLDRCSHGGRAGSSSLGLHLRRVGPRLHLCGHIHEANGFLPPDPHRIWATSNAALVDLRNELTCRPPRAVDVDARGVHPV